MESVASPGIGVALSLERPDETSGAAVAPEKVTLAEAAQMDLSEVFDAMLKERCAEVSRVHGPVCAGDRSARAARARSKPPIHR